MKLEDILRRSEGKTLEFKRDLSSPKGILKSLVAFSNTAGGTMLIGVADGTRTVLGLEDVRKEEERLANLIADSIAPQVLPDIEVVSWRNRELLAVEIFPSNTRPHHLKALWPEEGTFIRIGSTNRKADPAQVAELKRIVRMDCFDEQPLANLRPEALDLRFAASLLGNGRKLPAQFWQTLRVTTAHQGRQVPTAGGLILFGKKRHDLFPDAWIQCGRFPGESKAQIADSVELRSYLPLAIDEALAFLRKHLQKRILIQGSRHQEIWSVPLVSLREALINAVAHADYSQPGSPIRVAIFDDRVTIENPGLLPFGLTLEDIQHGVSKLRNRVIARVLRELKMVEQWGSGVQRMNQACEEAGLAPPEFEEIGSRFRVTFPMGLREMPKLDPIDDSILKLLRKRGPLATSAVAEAIGRSARATVSRLKSLAARGLLSELASGPNDPKRKYAALKGHR